MNSKLKTLNMSHEELACLNFLYLKIARQPCGPNLLIPQMGRFITNRQAFKWFKENGYHEDAGSFFIKHHQLFKFNFQTGCYENLLPSVNHYIELLVKDAQKKVEPHVINVEGPPQKVTDPVLKTESGKFLKERTPVIDKPFEDKRKELISSTSIIAIQAKKQYEHLKTVNDVERVVKMEIETKEPDANHETYLSYEHLRQHDVRQIVGIKPAFPWPPKYRYIFDSIMARHPEWNYEP